MKGRSNCDLTATQRAHKSSSNVASPAQREGATVETTYMLALRNEGPPPDAKRAQAALKYMPPDGPKATVKWPSKEGQRGRRGVSLAVACGGSLGRMELAGTKHILRINNGEEDYATMDVSGVAEEDLKRLAPSFIEQPKAPRPAKKPRRFADVLQDGPAATWSEAPPPMIQREKPKPAKASQARQRKRPLLEMAQLRGDFGGRKAYVSRVLCGPRDIVGQAAQPGGLLEAAGNLTQTAMPNLARSHIDALLAERGTACFVAHTIDENDLDGDSTAKDDVLGCAAVRRAHAKLFQVSFLCVAEASRNKGVGSQLVRRLLSHARKYKVPRVAVYADKKSLPFFAHRGFRPMEKKDLPPGQCDCLDHYSESTLVVAKLSFPGSESRASELSPRAQTRPKNTLPPEC